MFPLVFTLIALLFPLQDKSDEVKPVIERATAYVVRYEADLGNLIGSEEYVQSALWTSPIRGATGSGTQKKQRRTTSDFLILQVGQDWMALRKVNVVDGVKLKEKAETFEDAFDASPAGNMKRLKSMAEESAHYNIGDVVRTINTPTFALKVLRPAEVKRFQFEKAGVEKINSVQTWAIRFREVVAPALVQEGEGGVEIYSRGTLWIEPDSGRVLKTEFIAPNPGSRNPLTARVVVTYVDEKKLNMLVPGLMTERYDANYHTIDCRADYTNFRPFEVDVKFDIAPPKPR